VSGDNLESTLDQLALKFFKLYAQYEFSLKSNGFFIYRSGKIIVDWDRFVNEQIGSNFLEQMEDARQSAEFILEHPPKKQVVNGAGRIVWGDVPNNERSVQILFAHIGRIRNNMFHGAKFNGTWFSPERNFQLISNGIVVLEHFKTLACTE
tara:strand:+ start:383 stop:835 length:453 start_codon:yes stop_codon:yes gene_type:complete